MADSLVAGWLSEIGLETVISTFREEGIDSEALAALDDVQLKELGVKRMGDRTKLRAKAMGIALPAPFASPPGHRATAPQQQPENGSRGNGGGQQIPEHLQVLKRLSAASNSPNGAPNGGQRPRVRTTVDDLAEKISATNFVLAGGPLEKYTNGGKGKPHKKFFRMLPDKKLNYDGKSVGPVLSVLNGCGPIVQEHHNVSAETAGRSFRVVCEGGVSLLLIAPSSEEKTKWMEGIEIMLIGGYKRKKETLADPLSVSATDKVNPPGVPARPQRPVSAAPKVEVHQGLGLPSVRNDGTGSGGVGKEAPTAPPRRAGAEIADGGMRRPESALEQHSTNKSSVPASARNPAPLAAPAPGMRGEGEVMRRVLNVQPPAEATQSFIPKKAAHATSSQAPPPAPAPVPEQPASEQDMQKPKKLSVLQMASNFAQVAEESSPALLPAPAPTRGAPPPAIAPSAIEVPTLKWLTSDRVLKVDGNTVVKASSNAASPAEEYGVAVADVVLSSGVHEWEVEVGGKGLHWCGIGVARPDIQTGNSLRRPESRGRAWFYHSKGFLCNGDEFVGDWESTPTFASGDRIRVRVDLKQGVMSFTCNGKQVPCGFQGISSQVVPVLYMDNVGGQPSSCTFVSLPAPAK